MKDLQLINELCESRVFRTKQSIGKFSDKQKSELFYGILLSTLALAQDTKTNKWAEKYASAAAAFGNFDYFRTSGTDLYTLAYILQEDLHIMSKAQSQALVRIFRGLGRGSFDRSLIEQTLLRMERSLHISNSQLRNARRIIVNWTKSSGTERKQAVTRLHRYVRTLAKLAEVLPYLLVLTKDDKGHFGKMTPLKKAAAIAAAGLAGLVIGYKTHDPNKRRFNIINKEDIDIDDTPLTEDRATQLFQLVKNMSQHPEIEKVVNVQSLVDGISAFVRTTDGNAYEMEIRPARYAKTHTAHLREGWEWESLNEEDEPKCQWCYDTGYTKEKQWDDVVKVPCDQCDAERIKEDDWSDDDDGEDTYSGIALTQLDKQTCPTCEEPMDKVQLYPESKPTYICTNCL